MEVPSLGGLAISHDRQAAEASKVTALHNDNERVDCTVSPASPGDVIKSIPKAMNLNLYASKTYAFLKPFKATTKEHNLVALSKGRWLVPKDKIDEFIALYVSECERFPFALVFIKSEIFPYCIDLDKLHLALSLGPPLEVFRMVMSALAETESDRGNPDEYLMEHRKGTNFHAVFPDFIVDQRAADILYDIHLRRLNQLHGEIPWNKIVDPTVIQKNGIRLIGSYKYVNELDESGKPKTQKGADGKEYDVLRPDLDGGSYMPCTFSIDGKDIDDIDITFEAVKARLLYQPHLTDAAVTTVFPPEGYLEELQQRKREHKVQGMLDNCRVGLSDRRVQTRPATTRSQYTTDQIQGLLDILDAKRFDDYNMWRDLCYALHDLGEDYKGVFLEASQKCVEKFDLHRAVSLWDEAAKGPSSGDPITVGSLLFWAKSDNPDAYNKWRDLQIPALALDVYDKGDRGLAQIVHHELSSIIKLVPGAQKRTFYLFDQNECLWKRVFDGSVKMHFSFALDRILNKIWNRLECQKESAENEEEADKLQTNINVVANRMYYIRNANGLSNVLSLAAELFMDETFEDKLDSVRHLIGVQNGVVDLRTGELRDRRPEDMIHKLAKANYDPTIGVEWFNQVVKTIMAGSEEMTEFLQRFLGYAITGEVKEHVFGVFTNSGRNGKGLIMHALEKLLGSGEFYFEMNPGIIVDQHVSNLGDELRKGKGGRIWCFNELGENRKLKNEVVQMISGGDGMPAKAVYTKSETLIPYQTCIAVTNHMPEIGTVTRAIADRLLCIEFPVYFTEFGLDDIATPTFQQIDPDLGDQVEDNLGAVLKWLVDGAVRYYQNPRLKRTAPEAVTNFTRTYLDENDTFLQFLMENFEIGRDYAAYTAAILDRYNEHPARSDISDRHLRPLMESMGYRGGNVRVDGGAQKKGYRGLRLRERDVAAADVPFLDD